MIELLKVNNQDFSKKVSYKPKINQIKNIITRELLNLKPIFSDISDDDFLSLACKIAVKQQKLQSGNKSQSDLIRITYQIEELMRQLADKKAEKNKVKWLLD